MSGARHIDLNADVGEGTGQDAALVPLVTSANIACGAHAGDDATMRATVALALEHGVAIGAHPGFADRAHFGRRELALVPAEIRTLVRTQIEALRALGPVRHVKAHGALYNLAARDSTVAAAVAAAVRDVDPALIVFAPPDSAMLRAAQTSGLRVAIEAFADRGYRRDGSLVPRSEPGALLDDADAVATQALRLVRERRVRAIDGADVALAPDTLCLHGDGPHAIAFARRLREEFAAVGVEVRAVQGTG